MGLQRANLTAWQFWRAHRHTPKVKAPTGVRCCERVSYEFRRDRRWSKSSTQRREENRKEKQRTRISFANFVSFASLDPGRGMLCVECFWFRLRRLRKRRCNHPPLKHGEKQWRRESTRIAARSRTPAREAADGNSAPGFRRSREIGETRTVLQSRRLQPPPLDSRYAPWR